MACGKGAGGAAQGKMEAFTTRSLTVHPNCECTNQATGLQLPFKKWKWHREYKVC